jgi:hypothetical protein
MKIGYAFDMGLSEATPSAIRALKEAKEILEKNGHEFVKIDMTWIQDFIPIFTKLMMPYRRINSLDSAKYEPIEPPHHSLKTIPYTSDWVIKLKNWAIRKVYG